MSILINDLNLPDKGKCKTVTIFDDGVVCAENSAEIVGRVDERLKVLCQRRKEVGAIPWNPRSKESLNAKVELHRIDGLIVEKVLELFDE